MTDQQSEMPAREQLLTVEVRALGEAVVVAVAGEIDMATAQRLRDGLRDGFELVGAGPMVVDLTDVRFLGSAGLALLVQATSTARREQLPLRIVVDNAQPVIRPIEIANLDKVLALYKTVDDAMIK